MSFWVYILRCADGSYYTGHTDNLETRIVQHVTGAIPSCYTFNRRPVECVFSQEFPTREEALASEQQIKGWGRKKKEAMVRGDWAEVSRLARSSVDASEGPTSRRDGPSNCPSTGSGRTVEGPGLAEDSPAAVRPEPVLPIVLSPSKEGPWTKS
jgi:predicted GIY-YIG superfamily endonuclease